MRAFADWHTWPDAEPRLAGLLPTVAHITDLADDGPYPLPHTLPPARPS